MESNLFSTMGVTPLTLSQFTTRISGAVNSTPGLSGVWVTAELSDVRVNGGHCYMELVEKNSAGTTVAKLRATIWASTYRNIRMRFLAEAGKEIMTGMKVMLRGNATHHSLYGLAFNVVDIDPSYTLGDIERIRREILQKLFREGVIENNKKLKMPGVPQRIAIISATGAAGYGDFMNQLEANTEGFVFYPFLFPAVMQGERVAASVSAALDRVESTIDLWDCVVILRGGGATTDLIGFDNYDLARRVATFPLPVIVGIGHERDRTVLDELAHTRVKTPTAAAEYLTGVMRGTYDKIRRMEEFISSFTRDKITGEKTRLSNLTVALPAILKARLTAAMAENQKLFAIMPAIIDARVKRETTRLKSYFPLLGNITGSRIKLEFGRLAGYPSKISMVSLNRFNEEKAKYKKLEELVNVLSPTNTLRRGYAVVRRDGHAVTDATTLHKGETLDIKLHSGEIRAEVK